MFAYFCPSLDNQGATAVLAYGAIDSPLAQPRNIFCGHVIGSLTGVIIAQLFLNIQHNWASEAQLTAVQWVGGATAMAMALNIMQFTKTVHPPAGATALIAVVTPNIIELSWYYIGIVAVSAVIQICVACLVNNAEKRYPQYWWTPETPIKLDPANLATVMPAPVSALKGKDEIVLDNLTAAEEGRLKQQDSSGDSSLHSSSPTSNSGVDLAINMLQNHVFDSHTPYVLLTPGAQLSVTPGLLDDSEQETLKALLQKLNTKAH